MNDISLFPANSAFDSPLRSPPVNLQAEQALLGAIMANPKALHAVVEFLKPDHFADPVHGRIYQESVRRILAGGVADPISLKTWFAGDPDVTTSAVSATWLRCSARW